MTFDGISNTLGLVMKALVVILSLLLIGEAQAQVKLKTLRRGKVDSLTGNQLVAPGAEVAPAVSGLLDVIERSIQAGSVATFSENLASQVMINIAGGESGYFSANQTVSVLQNFFTRRRPISFSFTRLNANVPNPYATGRLSYLYKGTKETAQIYVSLSPQDSRWVVSQFNIY